MPTGEAPERAASSAMREPTTGDIALRDRPVDRATNRLEKESHMSEEVSTLRLYMMRVMYLGNFVMLGLGVWPEIIQYDKAWDPLPGVAFSFWAALSVLSGVGVRHPLTMLPLLLLQLFYKAVWLVAVAPSLWSAGRSTEMINVFAIASVLLLLVIPWPYVLAHYVKKPGDRWRGAPGPDRVAA